MSYIFGNWFNAYYIRVQKLKKWTKVVPCFTVSTVCVLNISGLNGYDKCSSVGDTTQSLDLNNHIDSGKVTEDLKAGNFKPDETFGAFLDRTQPNYDWRGGRK